MASGRFGEDDGEPVDLAHLKIGSIKVDLDDRPHRGTKGLVVLSYEVTSTEVGPVGGKEQSTLAAVGKCKVIGAVPLPDGFDRQKLWDTIDADVAAKRGRPQFEFDDEGNPLDTVELGDGPARTKRTRKRAAAGEEPGDDPGE
jgi:hypothetical protein